jgi:arylsulfatase A-like enzyme
MTQLVPDNRPNILLVFTDQQSARALSCAGNPFVNTPNMDELAARGVRFERSYCAAPICGPARASLVTGCPASVTGVRYNGQTPREDLRNMGEALREVGYRTLWFGKWHLPESYPKERAIRGFEYCPLPDEFTWPGQPRGDATDMFYASESYRSLCWDLTGELQPWMMCVSLHNPHDICYECMREDHTPKHNASSYPPLPADFNAPADEPRLLKEIRQLGLSGQELPFTAEWDEIRWRSYLSVYYRMVESVDRSVGLILEGLRSANLVENTLVIFTSDHGEALGTHRMVCKNTFVENVVNVPLILSWPGVLPAGATRQQLVSSLDIASTCCVLSGAQLPRAGGIDLMEYCLNGDTPGREYVGSELWLYPEESGERGRMIRSASYKYVQFSGDAGGEQLFDMKDPMGEQTDLSNDPAHEATLRAHRKLCEDYFTNR